VRREYRISPICPLLGFPSLISDNWNSRN
jgi:hypothetical protein